MEDKNRSNFLIILVIVLAVSLGGGLYFYYSNKNQKEQPIVSQEPTAENPIPTEGPKKGELDYQETETKIEIGTGGLSKGTYERIENNNIFIRNGDTLTQYPLTTDEFNIQCTTQDLTSANELDYDLINNVKIASAATANRYLTEDENIVLLSQNVNGVITAHTAFKNSSNCQSEIFNR